MRISNSPFSGIAPQPDNGDSLQPPLQPNTAQRLSNPTIQFGATPTQQPDATQSPEKQLLSLLIQLLKGNSQTQNPTAANKPGSVDKTPTTTQPDTRQPVDSAKTSEASFLDDSKYSSPKELERWAPMVANLPPEQREQAAKELNRPIAAARMAAEKGPNAARAMDFINANPALKTAVDTGKHGGKADGKITDGDLKAFAKNMQKAADSADKDMANYQKDHPDADPQSLEMVRSAALMRANEPLTKAADPKHALGAEGKTKVDGLTSADGLKAIQNDNPGLAGPLKQAAKTWSQPGFLTQIDQGGLEGRALAAHSPDKLFNAGNISDWIKKQAPTNGGEFASMLSDAATLNSVADVDISTLNKDVFDNPSAYSGEQKAAVMVKLQQTQQSVVAGADLRKTGKTEDALSEKIAQLQADPDVQAFLAQQVPQQSRALVGSTPSLQKAVTEQMQKVNSGQALATDMATTDKAAEKAKGKDKNNPDYRNAVGGLSAQLQMQRDLFGDRANTPTVDQVLANRPDLQGRVQSSFERQASEINDTKQTSGKSKAAQARDIYDTARDGLSDAKKVYDSVAKSAGRAGLGEVAAKVGGRVAGMVAGEAAGMAAGAAIGASIPVVGWIADAAMSLGFGISAIIEAVKKHKAQKAFDHNVDPVLDQFGIPKAH